MESGGGWSHPDHCKKRNLWIVFLIVLVFGFSLTGDMVFGAQEASSPVLPSMPKALPEGFGSPLRPNVLLLLDTSGSMAFDGNDNCTYGDGSRPYFKYRKTKKKWVSKGIYFGKDTDSSNNDSSNPNDYHPLLTFLGDSDGDFPEGIFTATEDVLDAISHEDDYLAKSGGKYLFPNDSRMYKLKLVLWRLLQDPRLVSGLRMGLATYHQLEGDRSSYSHSTNWYRWRPRSSGDQQTKRWNGDSRRDRAILREPFVSTDNPSHLSNLKMWVDGAEYYGDSDAPNNPELRADGHTPLAASIYNDSGENADCAYDFFKAKGTIQGWCQENWLIVLTDGADTAGGDPAESVRSLYENSPLLTNKKYFDMDNEPVKTMAIGFIDPDDADNSDLVATLNNMADYGDDGLKNGSAMAYFANDVDSLLEAFQTIFNKIQQRKGTGGAPLVSPGSGLTGHTTSAYVASFVPKPDDQWTGTFYKYSLQEGAMPESPDWEAGEILSQTSYSSRTVYTIDRESVNNPVAFSGADGGVLDLLTVGDIDVQVTGPDDPDKWGDFCRWVLGSQEYDSQVSERWKLGDVFHSGLTEVGAPTSSNPHSLFREFSNTWRERETLVYVQANDGMLHAFNSNDNTAEKTSGGVERWAFIPPNVLECGRLIGLKGIFSEANFLLDNDGTESVPRYLLDGPLVAEDVYGDIDGGGKKTWQTLLVGLSGYAGAGMYALDITDPDEPKFLWAVENSIYEPNGSRIWNGQDKDRKRIIYWKGQGKDKKQVGYTAYDYPKGNSGGGLPSNLDYRDLRFTVSVPVLGSIKYVEADETSHAEPVMIMGNGSDMGIDNINTGCVYFVDLMEGKILKEITANPMKMIVSPITALHTNNAGLIQRIYFGDNNGRLYEAHEGDNWAEAHELLNIAGANGPSYKIEVGTFRGQNWLFAVTGDSDRKVFGVTNGNGNGNPVYGSANNYFVAFNSEHVQVPLNMSSQMTEIDPDTSGSVSPASAPGYYFKLDKDEFPTTPPTLYNGYTFFSTFKSNEDPCRVGTSRLYTMEARTGKGAWRNDDGDEAKFIEFSGFRTSGITASNGKLYIGMVDFSGKGISGMPDDIGDNATYGNNLLVFDIPDEITSTPYPIESGQMKPRYWREWYHR